MADQAAEGAAQVVGEAVGDGAQVADEGLDAVEHGVEGAGEAVELVAGAAQRDAAVEGAGHDGAGGAVDLADAAGDEAGEQPAGGERERGDRGEGPEQGAGEGGVEGGAGLDVAADEEELVLGQAQGEGGDAGRAAAVGAVEVEGGPAVVGGDGRRPSRQVAGDAAALCVGEEVDGVALGRVVEARADGAGEGGGAAALVVVGEAADLGLDDGALLLVDDAADAPVEEAEDEGGGDGDEDEVRRDQPHGGVAEHGGQDPAASRRSGFGGLGRRAERRTSPVRR